MPAARNIELKARIPDLAAARATAQRLATEYLGVLQQRDTYFRCAQGRLKLREIDGVRAQLIAYERANHIDAKASDYTLVEIADSAVANQLRAALTAALGITVVVEKRREVFLYHNVRIHLDEVAGLGSFLEFEAVLGGAIDDEAGHEQLSRLHRELGILPDDRVAVSYCDLLQTRASDSA